MKTIGLKNIIFTFLLIVLVSVFSVQAKASASIYFVNDEIKKTLIENINLIPQLNSIITSKTTINSDSYTITELQDNENWIILHVVANNESDSENDTFSNFPEHILIYKTTLEAINLYVDEYDKTKLPKEILDQLNINKTTKSSLVNAATTPNVTFKLPWTNQSGPWKLNGGWHRAGYSSYPSSGNFAIDLSPKMAFSLIDTINFEVLAPVDMHIVSVCKDMHNQSFTVFRDEIDQYYRLAHIDARTINYNTGDFITQGTKIGEMFKDNSNQDGWVTGGTTAGRCAWSNGTHIHLGLPQIPFETAEGYIFTDSLAEIKNNNELISSQGRDNQVTSTPSEILSPIINTTIKRDQDFTLKLGENLETTRLIISGQQNYYNEEVTTENINIKINSDSIAEEVLNVYLISKTLDGQLITKTYNYTLEKIILENQPGKIELTSNEKILTDTEKFILSGGQNVKHFGIRFYRTDPTFVDIYTDWVVDAGELTVNNLPLDGKDIKVALVTYYNDSTYKTTYYKFSTINKTDDIQQIKSLVNLNIREDSTVNSNILGLLKIGEVANLIETKTYSNSTWYKIETNDKKIGWVAGKYYNYTLAQILN